ncbi:MAG: NAD(+)/NADH kinase [Desulfobacteraceae bacterium]|nr:NAD(+)/NADH kinase [Desulfobacteraceae bacterium]
MTSEKIDFQKECDISVEFVGIITKNNNQPADTFAEQLRKWFKQKNIKVCLNSVDADMDILVILGGDGTLLNIAEEASRYAIPVIGINLGNLGFLTELTKNESLGALKEIISGSVTIENRTMLKAHVSSPKKDKGVRYALNDVVINKDSQDRILYLTTKADNSYITTYKTDGLIFSTPTGSTAYNLSAGGPLVYPGLSSILVTPICPFMLGSRPILLPSHMCITTRFETEQYRKKANIIVDGQRICSFENDDILQIETAKQPLRLIISPHRDYFAILRNKLHWGNQENISFV